MKNLTLVIGAILLLDNAYAGYFSATNKISNNRIILGLPFEMRSPDGALGLVYQRAIGDKWIAEGGCGGLDEVGGLHLSVGLISVWNENKRFRPLLRAGLSYQSGEDRNTVPYDSDSSITFRTYPGLYGNIGIGVQYRVFWRWGYEVNAGWAQPLYGGGYEIIDSHNAWGEKWLKTESNGGLMIMVRSFVEF